MTSMQQRQAGPPTSNKAEPQQQQPADGRQAAREEQLRKTNTLLVSITVIFSIW